MVWALQQDTALVPTSITVTMEPSATISDEDGNLHCYSDAVDVWDREHLHY